MTRLNINKKQFLILLHAIWSISVYYLTLFHFIPSDTAQESDFRLCVDDCNVTHILVRVSKNLDAPLSSYMPTDMKAIINEYIAFIFRDEYPEIKPFSMNGKWHEALYLYSVEDRGKYYTLDFVYIDSPMAFQVVKEDERQIII